VEASTLYINTIPLMMEAEKVSETLGSCPKLARLVTREDFIEPSRRKSFKSYTIYLYLSVPAKSDLITTYFAIIVIIVIC
jgi:hypothetical protein